MNKSIETLTLINGNKNAFSIDLPLIAIQAKNINDVGLAHIAENTGLHFIKSSCGYQAQAIESWQIAALFLTYNFKTKYFNNGLTKNTLMLKFDHHVGFNVDSICFECAEYNHIHTNGLTSKSRLSC